MSWFCLPGIAQGSHSLECLRLRPFQESIDMILKLDLAIGSNYGECHERSEQLTVCRSKPRDQRSEQPTVSQREPRVGQGCDVRLTDRSACGREDQGEVERFRSAVHLARGLEGERSLLAVGHDVPTRGR